MTRPPDPDPIEWVRARWTEDELPEADRFALAASLMRAHAAITARIEDALRPHELSLTAYLTLVTLALSDDGARSLSSLARSLLVHQTTVTQMVDRCEKRGLVRRRPHPSDRRTTLAAITRSGRALVRRATADAAAAGFGLSEIADGELAGVASALRQLRRGGGDLPG